MSRLQKKFLDYLKSIQWNDPGTGSFLFWFVHILFFFILHTNGGDRVTFVWIELVFWLMRHINILCMIY